MSNSYGMGKNTFSQAWGKPWPHQTSGIAKLHDHEPDVHTKDEEESGGSATALEIPETWSYTCVHNIRSLIRDMAIPVNLGDTLIIRDEYNYVRDVMEQIATKRLALRGLSQTFVLTGQPGIGKTAFLLYLLLYRLQRRLPTAIQFRAHKYILFDEEGATECDARDMSDKLSSGCWALCDSNASVLSPCVAFLVSEAVIVQATSPQKERWKEWRKQLKARVIIMDAPRPLEIVAIGQESHHDRVAVISKLQTWGTETRTILEMLETPTMELKYRRAAERMARAICATSTVLSPLIDLENMDRFGSSILFIRPVRVPNPKYGNEISFSEYVVYIPTIRLAEMFDAARMQASNANIVQLFDAFSFHAFTRSAADWRHEKRMHVYMCSGAAPLELISDILPLRTLCPARRLLPTTEAMLAQLEQYQSFYWFPAADNFEGIDGVLGDEDNIYILQAATPREHRSPTEGLRKVWDAVSAPTRTSRRWHFVVVTDEDTLAVQYARIFSTELEEGVWIDVWGCVLPA